MKQVLRKAGGRAAVLLGISLTGLGCTDEETGFFILGNVVVEAPECAARPEGTSTLLGAGLLDVALRPDYVANLLVGSQLAPRGDKTNLRTETMIATFTGAEVHLTGGPDVARVSFTVPAAGTTIPPNSSADPGFGIVSATLIPAAQGVDIGLDLTDRAQLVTRVAEVSVFGKTIGGLDIETAPFSYAINVCKGCIVEFPADAIDANGNCGAALNEAAGSPCRVGQDDPVDCRVCTAGNIYCQAPNGSVNSITP